VTWFSSSVLVAGASRALAAGAINAFRALLMLGAGLILVAVALDGLGQLRAGLAPDRHAYGATVATFIVVQGVTALAVLMMAAYTLARSWRGRLDQARRVTFDNTRLLWHYTVAQGLVGLGLTHVIPRALG
jgi:cytochrome c oxidase subunit I+III